MSVGLPESCEVCGGKATSWPHWLRRPETHNGRRFWRACRCDGGHPRCDACPSPRFPWQESAPGAVQVLDTTAVPPPRWPPGLYPLDGEGNYLRPGGHPVFVECLPGEVARNSRGEAFDPQPEFPPAPDAIAEADPCHW